MKTKVQKLPKNAVYDYTDVFGYKVYHTARRRYEVVTRNCFGKKIINIYSTNKED